MCDFTILFKEKNVVHHMINKYNRTSRNCFSTLKKNWIKDRRSWALSDRECPVL